jgi:DNA-binding transcriptional regulator YiaG
MTSALKSKNPTGTRKQTRKSRAAKAAPTRKGVTPKSAGQSGAWGAGAQRPTVVDVKALRDVTHLSQEKLARLVDLSWVTISRWERELAAPSEDVQARLDRLAEIVNRVGDALTPAELYRFLDTPHASLRGQRPVDLMKSEYAFQDLVAYVEGAKSGDMA